MLGAAAGDERQNCFGEEASLSTAGARKQGLLRELNPGPLAPEARIMPLDQAANETHGLTSRLYANKMHALAE